MRGSTMDTLAQEAVIPAKAGIQEGRGDGEPTSSEGRCESPNA